MSQTKIEGEVPQSQIDDWKKKHGELILLKSVDGKKVGYLKKVSRKAYAYAMNFAKSDPMQYIDVLIKDMWLGGDKTMLDDTSYFLGVASKINELVEIKEFELVKL